MSGLLKTMVLFATLEYSAFHSHLPIQQVVPNDLLPIFELIPIITTEMTAITMQFVLGPDLHWNRFWQAAKAPRQYSKESNAPWPLPFF